MAEFSLSVIHPRENIEDFDVEYTLTLTSIQQHGAHSFIRICSAFRKESNEDING